MSLLKKLSLRFRNKPLSPKDAYNLWSETYDSESDNLVLYFDDLLLKELLSKTSIINKSVLDFGCGTGRNWPLLFSKQPKEIIGCDISSSMLKKLEEKYPSAKTFLLHGNSLPFGNFRFDFVVSTLVAAHIKNIKEAFTEWNRVLKQNGEIIITDFHPEALAKGGKRIFYDRGKNREIINYIHSIEEIKNLFSSLGLNVLDIKEKVIDESVKEFYERKKAIGIYNEFKNTPLIYGMRLVKK